MAPFEGGTAMLRGAFPAFRGLLYAGGFVLLWWWIITWARSLDSGIAVSFPVWLRGVGFAIAVTGALVALWCVATFALVGRGTPAPFDAPREFVAVGPYRFVRNPMYLGGLAVIVGIGLILGSVGVLAVAGLFVAFAHAFVLLYEEPTLERRFGESYRRYRTAVNRWLPDGRAGAR